MDLHWFADELPLLDIIDEMVMSQTVVMEQVHKDLVVGDKCAGDVWIWETLDCHRPIVEAKQAIDVKFIGRNLFWRPLLWSEIPQSKLAIIAVDDGELLSI